MTSPAREAFENFHIDDPREMQNTRGRSERQFAYRLSNGRQNVYTVDFSSESFEKGVVGEGITASKVEACDVVPGDEYPVYKVTLFEEVDIYVYQSELDDRRSHIECHCSQINRIEGQACKVRQPNRRTQNGSKLTPKSQHEYWLMDRTARAFLHNRSISNPLHLRMDRAGEVVRWYTPNGRCRHIQPIDRLIQELDVEEFAERIRSDDGTQPADVKADLEFLKPFMKDLEHPSFETWEEEFERFIDAVSDNPPGGARFLSQFLLDGETKFKLQCELLYREVERLLHALDNHALYGGDEEFESMDEITCITGLLRIERTASGVLSRPVSAELGQKALDSLLRLFRGVVIRHGQRDGPNLFHLLIERGDDPEFILRGLRLAALNRNIVSDRQRHSFSATVRKIQALGLAGEPGDAAFEFYRRLTQLRSSLGD
jgi:hypothetical protein